MKINKVELIDKATTSFTVKTKDIFIKITEFEFDRKIKIGDRLEI